MGKTIVVIEREERGFCEKKEFDNIREALDYLVMVTNEDLATCIKALCGEVQSPSQCPYTDDCDICLSLVGNVEKCVKLIRSKSR